MSQLKEPIQGSMRLTFRTDKQTTVTRIPIAESGALWASKYQRRLWVSDTSVLITVLLLAVQLRFSAGGGQLLIEDTEVGYVLISAVVAVLWMATLGVYRTRDIRVVGLGLDEYKRVVSATVSLLGILAILALVLKIEVARGYFAIALPLGVVGLLTSRWLMRTWLHRQRLKGHFLSRVVVLGRPGDVRYVIGQIHKKSGAAYQIVGAALPAGNTKTFMGEGTDVIPVVASINTVVDAVKRFDVDAVIVAGPVKGGSKYVQELGWDLEGTDTEIILATGLTSVSGPRIHARPVEGLPLMHIEQPQYKGFKHVLKRALDIALSASALLVLLPVFALLAFLIRRDSDGQALFRQERIGRTGEKFIMYKFRSMVEGAGADRAALESANEGAGPLFKMRDDPRITKTGRWLRRYSLDELPQFWNVFIGDMSLVGPRPPLASEVEKYETRVLRRLYIKPGLTGMWQVNGRSELDWQDSVRLDLYYVENWSLAGDLLILLRTARMLIRPEGAF